MIAVKNCQPQRHGSTGWQPLSRGHPVRAFWQELQPAHCQAAPAVTKLYSGWPTFYRLSPL